MRDAVVICAEDIIAIINKTDVFQRCTECIDEEIDKHQNHIFVGQHYFQLRQKRQLFFFHAGLLLRHALFGKVIFKERQRQRKDGKNAHHENPFGLIHTEHGHNYHRENQCNDYSAHHNGGNLIEDRKTAALDGVARGERAHQVVRHIVDGIGIRIKQVIREHDPDDLNRLAGVWDGEKQNSRQRNERSRQKQPRARLALLGLGAVDDIAHNDICDCVYNFGDKREHDEKRTAPDGSQFQNIGVVDIQIGCKHGVEQERAAGTEQIPEPFFFTSDVLRVYAAVKQLCR